MLEITKPNENRVDLELSGSLTADEMREGLDDLIAKSEGVADGRMLYTITDFQFPTLAALGVETTRLPGLFGLVQKFSKCAVLTDKQWIGKVGEFKGSLFAGMDVKAFELTEVEAAEAWLEG